MRNLTDILTNTSFITSSGAEHAVVTQRKGPGNHLGTVMKAAKLVILNLANWYETLLKLVF